MMLLLTISIRHHGFALPLSPTQTIFTQMHQPRIRRVLGGCAAADGSNGSDGSWQVPVRALVPTNPFSLKNGSTLGAVGARCDETVTGI